MADARVIPFDGERLRPATARASSAVSAGADRAGGERARRRRRTTPLLDVGEPEPPADDHAEDVSGRREESTAPAATTSPARKSPATKRPAGKPAGARSTSPRRAAAKRSPARQVAAAGKASTRETATPKRAAREAAGREAAVREASAEGERLAAGLREGATGSEVEQRVAAALAFLRRRLTGDYEVDEFGFDAQFTDVVVMNLLRPLYRKWFRVEVRGIENIPARGGALVVANHSGTVALDALMTQVAVHDEHPQHRHLRMLGADLVFSLPVIGDIARKSGSTLAANPDAERLLSGGELVGVWPEGFKGIGKPFSERYKLQRFGRGGFVSAALRTATPIVPCAIVGAEEIYPILGNLPSVARLLGVPYAPITPTWPWLGLLGLVPLPSKWLIEFGEPIATDDHGESGAEDPMLVFDLTDQVRETIQQTLYSLLVSRRSVFF